MPGIILPVGQPSTISPGTIWFEADGAHCQPAISGSSPVGTIIAHASSAGPGVGWLECNGQNVSRTTYASLFNSIGTVWGAGDGSTTFTLPDFRRRTLIGAGGTAVSGPANTVGSVGGEETHTLSVAEMPSHHHGYFFRDNTINPGTSYGASTDWQSVGTNTTDTGGSLSHNNMQPSAVVSYWIKA